MGKLTKTIVHKCCCPFLTASSFLHLLQFGFSSFHSAQTVFDKAADVFPISRSDGLAPCYLTSETLATHHSFLIELLLSRCVSQDLRTATRNRLKISVASHNKILFLAHYSIIVIIKGKRTGKIVWEIFMGQAWSNVYALRPHCICHLLFPWCLLDARGAKECRPCLGIYFPEITLNLGE